NARLISRRFSIALTSSPYSILCLGVPCSLDRFLRANETFPPSTKMAPSPIQLSSIPVGAQLPQKRRKRWRRLPSRPHPQRRARLPASALFFAHPDHHRTALLFLHGDELLLDEALQDLLQLPR